jgi:integrase
MGRLLLQQSAAYYQFVNSLRSKETKIHYTNWLADFLNYLNISCDKVLELNSNQLQQEIINYTIDMRDNRKLSPSSIRSHISAIQTFLIINDFGGINWIKVKKFVGEFYKVADDRPYTRDEIKQLVDAAHSLRDKAIILLLSSSGIRVGGLVRLQLKHLIPNNKYGIYQIDVYKKSREAYTTFCTPESRDAIDLYLDWRRKLGERLTPESPLFRVEFDIIGGISAVERGELILIAAGSKKIYNRAKSLFNDISKQVIYVGSNHSAASTLKLAVNINIALIALAFAEGLAFVKGTGLDPDIFLKILNSTYFRTGLSENKGPKIINDEYAPSFSLANMTKDLKLTLQTAYNSGLTLPTTSSSHAIYKASEAAGLSKLDYTSVASFILRLNDIRRFGKGKNQSKDID